MKDRFRGPNSENHGKLRRLCGIIGYKGQNRSVFSHLNRLFPYRLRGAWNFNILLGPGYHNRSLLVK